MVQEADDASASARSDPGHVERRTEARRAYGLDPATYNAGRPDYPHQVYRVLEERCGLRPGIAVLESGPGSGQVTRHLVDAGAHVTAVEPDPAMGEFLRKSLPQGTIDVVESTFEDAPLGDESFDLVVAATSFHWADPSVGLPKIGRVVRSEGWVALWWTSFGDPDRADPFHEATKAFLGDEARPIGSASEFQLDRPAREAELVRHARLVEVSSEVIPWTARLGSVQVRSLYGSFFNVIQRPADERAQLLDSIEMIATSDFGGVIERPFVTVLYTGRR